MAYLPRLVFSVAKENYLMQQSHRGIISKSKSCFIIVLMISSLASLACHMKTVNQCDQIGLFWKLLGTNFLAKITKYLATFGLFWQMALFKQNFCDTFVQRFYFYILFLFQHLFTLLGDLPEIVIICNFESNLRAKWPKSVCSLSH